MEPGAGCRFEEAWSWKRLWCLLPAVIGLFFLLAPWIAADAEQEPVDPGALVILTVLGLAGTAVGWGLGLRRRGFDFEAGSTRYARWWGVGVPWVARFDALEAGTRVGVTQETRRGHRARSVCFPLQLIGPTGRTTLREFGAYRPARQAGERLAKCLHCPLEDTGTGERIIRDVKALDASVRDQARSARAVPPRPEPFDALALWHEVTADGAEVRIAPIGLRNHRGIACAVSSGATLVGWWVVFHMVEGVAEAAATDPDVAAVAGAVRTVLWSLVLIPVVFGIVPALWGAFTRDRVLVTRDLLRLERSAPGRRRIYEMDAPEIERIAVQPRERDWRRRPGARDLVVSVQSDDGFLELARGRSEAEQEWLRDLLLHFLAG